VVEVYPHTKLDGNRKNFVDVRTYGRTDTPEFQSTRSSPRRWPNQKAPQGGCGHRRQNARLR